jgi:hypothetical protein
MMRAVACLGIALVAAAVVAQDYEIVDRLGHVSASATIARGRLTIVESTGQRVVFDREPRYDSADGQLLGFYNADLQRVLRFPIQGHGLMQVADLDRPNPAFRQTQRSVRPAEVDLGIGYVPGYGNPGYGAGYPLPVPSASPYPYVWGYRPPLPRSVLLDSKTVANPPLEPVLLELGNGGPREILVTVVDLRTGETNEHRIGPAQQVQVKFQRDAGGKRFQRYQTVTPAGASVVKEVVSEIAPAIRYELTVREWVVQSIAIDRTGKSPTVIEDVNYQGNGLGRFTLPPGQKLQSGQLDVYRAAISAANRGSIAPIPVQEKPIGDGLSPLERAIQNLQRGR